MKTLLFAAFVLTPALALAGSQAYVLHNGRRGGGGGGAPVGRSYNAVSTPRPSFVRAAPTRSFFGTAGAAVPARSYTGGYRGFSGGSPGRTSSRHSFANAAPLRLNHIVRRGVMSATGGTGGSSGGSTGGADTTPPPNYTKPGALIRTEGQLPAYSDPGNARTTSVEGGSFVDIDPRKAKDVARAPGVAWGAPDTPPTVNPTTGGGGAGGNGVTANGPAITIDNSHSGNVNGNQNGGNNGNNGNGGGNGNSAPTGTGFDPSF
jgi:hypothetical protein